MRILRTLLDRILSSLLAEPPHRYRVMARIYRCEPDVALYRNDRELALGIFENGARGLTEIAEVILADLGLSDEHAADFAGDYRNELRNGRWISEYAIRHWADRQNVIVLDERRRA